MPDILPHPKILSSGKCMGFLCWSLGY